MRLQGLRIRIRLTLVESLIVNYDYAKMMSVMWKSIQDTRDKCSERARERERERDRLLLASRDASRSRVTRLGCTLPASLSLVGGRSWSVDPVGSIWCVAHVARKIDGVSLLLSFNLDSNETKRYVYSLFSLSFSRWIR